jgi:AsmA protein
MKAIKWAFIVVVGLIVLVVVALLVIPMFVDADKYKPRIEKIATDFTGRPVSIGGELRVSLFPWAGLTMSEFRMGNPPGFKEKDFASIKSFDIQVKLLPLIFKDIQIKRFVIENPNIFLIKAKNGRGNWEGIGRSGAEKEKSKPERTKPAKESGKGLPIGSLAAGEISIKNGALTLLDHSTGERREIKDLSLQLRDVSLERPIQLSLSASLDKKPISLEGKLGPLGKDPGKGILPLDFSIKALNELNIKLKGQVIDPAITPKVKMALQVEPFSPRKLMESLGAALPVAPSGPNALDHVALSAQIQGNVKSIELKDGVLDLDDSKLRFLIKVKDFSKPDLAFDINIDQIEFDRYLPPPSGEPEAKKEQPTKKSKTDYGPLRKLVLDGKISIGKAKVKGAQIQDLKLRVRADKGILHLDPLSLNLYEGHVTGKGKVDVRQDVPKTNVKLQVKGVQAKPLLMDFLQKDFLEGNTQARFALRMVGDDPDKIKRSINGKGELLFKNGAIVGIDLAGMVRNLKAKIGLEKETTKKPRTDFAEFRAPFEIINGTVKTSDTKLLSPLLRVKAVGNADLPKETLDFRVAPKFVATLKGQGDKKDRSGVMVPVLITGTFSSPKFRPDLKGMLKQGIPEQIPKTEDLKKVLKDKELEKQDTQALKGDLEDKAEGLLKGLGR